MFVRQSVSIFSHLLVSKVEVVVESRYLHFLLLILHLGSILDPAQDRELV